MNYLYHFYRKFIGRIEDFLSTIYLSYKKKQFNRIALISLEKRNNFTSNLALFLQQ